jgi:hypothetical protein
MGKKAEEIIKWRNLPENLPIMEHFTPIPANAKGSTFGACGIRISGSPQFIDAVLSRIKDVLSAEAGSTRLTFSRQKVKTVSIQDGDKVTEKQWQNAVEEAETCYIQVRERSAMTRIRKVSEHSDELPNLRTAVSKDKANKEEESKDDEEPKRSARIGISEDGEVIW